MGCVPRRLSVCSAFRNFFRAKRSATRNCSGCISRPGIEPQYAGPLPAPAVASTRLCPRLRQFPTAAATTAPAAESSDVSSLAKVAEITRKLYHQGNAEGVLKTAVNELGAHWGAARCIAALRKPGLPPSSVQEYHMDGLLPVSSSALVSVVEALQDLAVARGVVTINDADNAPELLSVRGAVEELQIESLMALPLAEGNDQIGVLILTQNSSRAWHPRKWS